MADGTPKETTSDGTKPLRLNACRRHDRAALREAIPAQVVDQAQGVFEGPLTLVEMGGGGDGVENLPDDQRGGAALSPVSRYLYPVIGRPRSGTARAGDRAARTSWS